MNDLIDGDICCLTDYAESCKVGMFLTIMNQFFQTFCDVSHY